MPQHLSTVNKARVVTMLENGWSIRRVAQELNVGKNTILRIKQRWVNEARLTRNVGSGRTKMTTADNDAALINYLRDNPFSTAVAAKEETAFPASHRTALRRIKNSNLRNYSAARKGFLTQVHQQRRLEFAEEYVNMDNNFWENVIFSDEKIFQSCHNSRVRLYRPRNSNRYSQEYVQQIKRSGRFSVNVWAWISVQGPGICWRIDERFTGNIYRTILDNVMLPSVTQIFDADFIFQQDNSPIHTSHVVTEWLEENRVRVLPWPANSADMNPIENVWSNMVKKNYNANFRPQNSEELWQAIENCWEEITPEYTQNLIYSMPRRLQSIIDQNGSFTKY